MAPPRKRPPSQKRRGHAFNQRFGALVRQWRIEKGFTSVAALAAMADLSMKFLGEVERGEKGITVSNAVIIAQALDVSLLDLIPREAA